MKCPVPLLSQEVVGSGANDPGKAYVNALLHARDQGFAHVDCHEIAKAESDRVRRVRDEVRVDR